MNVVITLFFLTIYVSFANAQMLDFTFYDSGCKEYRSITLIDQLQEKFNYRFESEKIILVETPSLKDSLFLVQSEILKQINNEQLGLIYVISCWNEVEKNGYHTSLEEAKIISAGNDKFRIRILNSKAVILYESMDILSAEEIELMH